MLNEITMKNSIRNVYYCVVVGMLLLFTYHVTLNLFVGELRFFAFTIDTIYLQWNTSFPAITICEMFNGEKTWDLSEKFYGSNRHNKLDDLISDLTFFNGKCYACNFCNGDMNCPSNFSELTAKFRTPCNHMIRDCFWNNKDINCCDAFLPLQTEFGKCFSINSMHTKPAYGHRLIANRISGPGLLSFIVDEDVQVHVHASNEVPTVIEGDIKEDVFYGTQKEIVFKVTEMVNDQSVQDVPIEYRKCRFTWERADANVESMYEFYSHSTCIIECLMKFQVEFCNCTHHLMPQVNGNIKICDIEGLICLTNNFGKISSLRRSCDCLSSCEEPDYTALYSSPPEIYRDEPGSLVTVSMVDLPKQRYVRRNVKTVLDYVISIGGVCSLFFGLSILSAIRDIVNLGRRLYGLRSKLTRAVSPVDERQIVD